MSPPPQGDPARRPGSSRRFPRRRHLLLSLSCRHTRMSRRACASARRGRGEPVRKRAGGGRGARGGERAPGFAPHSVRKKGCRQSYPLASVGRCGLRARSVPSPAPEGEEEAVCSRSAALCGPAPGCDSPPGRASLRPSSFPGPIQRLNQIDKVTRPVNRRPPQGGPTCSVGATCGRPARLEELVPQRGPNASPPPVPLLPSELLPPPKRELAVVPPERLPSEPAQLGRGRN
ncbi:uncharacterized protein LOC141552634 [Sminthopsis crassicaudata]|uniref:uncharacterized protein LOC141552634 n=1 Tax=Sminthopsis crassicaudata TaxID=9301 RepID=UPI003D695445